MLSDGKDGLRQLPGAEASQCPLEHCMLSDSVQIRAMVLEGDGSQCPLEHCMLSDERRKVRC